MPRDAWPGGSRQSLGQMSGVIMTGSQWVRGDEISEHGLIHMGIIRDEMGW